MHCANVVKYTHVIIMYCVDGHAHVSMFCVIRVNYSYCWAEKKVKSSKNRFLKTGFQGCVSLVCNPYIHVIQLTYIYAQIPRNVSCREVCSISKDFNV